ncbi:MAG: hypothetical protein AUI14_00380 [Actinobacteria bacterium 13_2_20CM_2_71_6]|nr:MAG: hypothetical protein AUI14_00380 [Actinobacteria bacterium 13_2_20CM_2_71_6]
MYDSIPALVERMVADLGRLPDGDARRFFHATYLRTTRAVAEEIDRGGFADGAWLERWDIAFARLYLDVLDADLRGEPVPRPWRVAFDAARDQPDLPPLRHVLLGMNAHINYDLPQALIAVISPAEFDDPAIRARRAADHTHVDDVLLARVGAEDDELRAVSRLTLLDRLLGPLNRAATRRLLTEARSKVWRNTAALDQARRAGPDRYDVLLRKLEALCAARLTELSAPGQVLLKLTRRGFGVVLPEAAPIAS